MSGGIKDATRYRDKIYCGVLAVGLYSLVAKRVGFYQQAEA